MKELLNEEWLLRLLNTARSNRIKQLEAEFVSWDEFKELVIVKNNIMNLLEEQIPRAVTETEILLQYDDAYGLLVTKASDYFYDRGFTDCLSVLEGAQAKKLLE